MATSPRFHDGGSATTKFWLEFRVFSDGLDVPAVTAMRAAAAAGGGSSAPERFAPFPSLPAEIRLKIWEYLIAPRIVAVACFDSETGAEQRRDVLLSRPSCPPVPVLLHVCRETRALALSRYELAFAWKVPHVLAGMDLLHHPFRGPLSPSSSSSFFSPHSSPHSSSPSSSAPTPPAWSPPRVWFNFALDAVYLLGELEPCDSYGFNSPMAYFLAARDARRVGRGAALAFGALRYGEAGAQQIFGSLFHVVDRFPPAGGRVLVAVTPADEHTHALVGGEGPLVPPPEEDEGVEGGWHGRGHRGGEGCSCCSYSSSSSSSSCCNCSCGHNSGALARQGREQQLRARRVREEGNVVQKIWRDWYRGSIVTSSLANIEFVLVREADLEKHLLDSIASASPVRKQAAATGVTAEASRS